MKRTRQWIRVKDVQDMIWYELANEQNSSNDTLERKRLVQDGLKVIGFDLDAYSHGRNYRF